MNGSYLKSASAKSAFLKSAFYGVLISQLVLAGCFVAGNFVAADEGSANQTLSGSTMGTYWQVQWREPGASQRAIDSLELKIHSELERLNALMSTWDPESELSVFNRSRSTVPTVLHADTLHVIDTAIAISLLTDGRYDITLQPVIDLWGFGKSTHSPTPDEAQITAALAVSGHALLEREGNTVRKRIPTLEIDVSSLAKGFAVDQLGEIVESHGIDRYLVDIGGELRARGVRQDDKPWKIGLEDPDGQVPRGVYLLDTHIATSGSYRNYRVENGKRLSHIIDGETGRPVAHDLLSASVIHESTMLADAWATALLIVGETAARRLIAQHGFDAQLTVFRDGQFQYFMTDGFTSRLVPQ